MENSLFPIFYPMFQAICHFIQLCKITQFFDNNFSVSGEGEAPSRGRPWLYVIDITNYQNYIMKKLKTLRIGKNVLFA